jgi:hypothetical protein
MTNFLSSAMLSAGAACFDSIIKIERNMSQAEINTLQASEEMMKAQPLMLTALQSSYNAQAHEQFVAGLIGGCGAMAAGAFQFGLTKMGDSAGDKAFNEDLEPGKLRVTSEKVESATPKATVEGRNEIELDDLSQKHATNDSTNAPQKTVEKEVAVEKNEQKTAEETKKDNKLREQKRLSKIQTYQNYAQLAGTSINGAATAGRSYFDSSATKDGGSASAMGTVIQGNQTAQSSNANMVQTYKEAFTNASQILAGIVSAQRN